ncbi:MAG: hypothetical protein RLZZ408_33 [Verrucomicrobiota bacterium]|jgi:hypothetical protein
MKKFATLIAIALLAGCAAPPPVRIASSVIGKTVGKKLKDDYQKAHPKASPSPTPVTVSNRQ